MDALQPGQRVLHMESQVVGQLQGVPRFVRRIERNLQEDAGCRLPDMNAEVLDVYRQSRRYVLDTVLRQHLRDVQTVTVIDFKR
jgi:hypothetical protein